MQPRHERDAEHGRHRGSTLDRKRRPAASARGGCVREAGAARPGGDAARRAGREPDGRQGRRLRRRQVVTYGAAARRQALQRRRWPTTTLDAGQCAGEAASAQYKLVGDARAAHRHPGQGHGHVHVRAQHPRARDAARPRRAAARPGRVRRRHAPSRSRSTRARSSTSRTSQVLRKGDFLGVVAPKEYDAIQAAAQLKVKWADPPTISGSGNLCKQMRRSRRAGQAPARIAAQRGNFDAGVRGGGEDGVGDATRTTTRGTCRSGRPAPSPTSAADGAIVYARTRRTATRCAARSRRCSALPLEQDPRRSTTRARASSATLPGTTTRPRRRR